MYMYVCVYIYIYIHHILILVGTSLAVQQLRPHTPNAGGPASIPGHNLQPIVCMLQQRSKIQHATTKTPTQPNK